MDTIYMIEVFRDGLWSRTSFLFASMTAAEIFVLQRLDGEKTRVVAAV